MNTVAKPGRHKVVLRATNTVTSTLLTNTQSYIILGEELIVPCSVRDIVIAKKRSIKVLFRPKNDFYWRRCMLYGNGI